MTLITCITTTDLNKTIEKKDLNNETWTFPMRAAAVNLKWLLVFIHRLRFATGSFGKIRLIDKYEKVSIAQWSEHWSLSQRPWVRFPVGAVNNVGP